jgi:HEAT repeat protein/MFS family permease
MSEVPARQQVEEPTNAEKIRRLPWSIASNTSNTVFVQYTFFGSAFVLFLNQLQLNNRQVGLLLSMFPFFGLVALFIGPAVGRYGFKRVFLTFYGLRKVVAAFLLLTPWVLSTFGSQAALGFVMVIVIVFALCRATSETALIPWSQEYIPNNIRGKYAALTNIFSRLTGVAAAAVGGYIIGEATGLNGFMILIAIGVIFGFISVWTATYRPGGASTRGTGAEQASLSDMLKVVRDSNFSRYMVGLGLITLGTVPMISFLPLFMREQVGLTAGQVIWLETGSLVGGMVSTYLWGWAADRYGSKPVMMFGVYAKVLLPIGWMLMPHNSFWSIYAALGIAFMQGITDVSWAIGSSRLLYVSVVPPEKKTEYLGFYYAAMGIFGGVSQLIGGWVLDASAGLTGQVSLIEINPHVPLFVAGLIFPVFSLFIFRRVRSDSPVSTSEFASMFLHGNPIYALGMLPRYYLAKDERSVVNVTERLGRTQSPLTVEELLDALNDPRFNVRFEAIISIARMRADPRLVEALEGIVQGTELSLSVVAAWALGRMGDTGSLDALREGLNSDYRSIRAHCARALGTLGDETIIPILLERLEHETDKGLQVAYGSALGNLAVADAGGPLIELLSGFDNLGARQELALAIARTMGDEQYYTNMLRRVRSDMGTAIAQELFGLAKSIGKDYDHDAPVRVALREAAQTFARQDIETGAVRFSHLLRLLLADDTLQMSQTNWSILEAFANRLDEYGAARIEFLLLSLNTLDIITKE